MNEYKFNGFRSSEDDIDVNIDTHAQSCSQGVLQGYITELHYRITEVMIRIFQIS